MLAHRCFHSATPKTAVRIASIILVGRGIVTRADSQEIIFTSMSYLKYLAVGDVVFDEFSAD